LDTKPGKEARHAGRQTGFTLIEVLIVVGILALVATIAIPTYQHAMAKSRRAALVADSHELYSGLLRYHVDRGQFPAMLSPPDQAFSLTTLEPLVSQGYFRGAEGFVRKLWANRILVYVAPAGVNDRFWLVLRERTDPRTLVVIAHTDLFPLDSGTWYDGVYFLTGAELVPASERS